MQGSQLDITFFDPNSQGEVADLLFELLLEVCEKKFADKMYGGDQRANSGLLPSVDGQNRPA